MRRSLTAVAAATLLVAATAHAGPVALRHADTELLGDLRVVSAGGLADGVIVLVHGTLAHHRMEIIETLQSLLAEPWGRSPEQDPWWLYPYGPPSAQAPLQRWRSGRPW